MTSAFDVTQARVKCSWICFPVQQRCTILIFCGQNLTANSIAVISRCFSINFNHNCCKIQDSTSILMETKYRNFKLSFNRSSITISTLIYVYNVLIITIFCSIEIILHKRIESQIQYNHFRFCHSINTNLSCYGSIVQPKY